MTRDLFDTLAARALGRRPKRTGPPTLEELERLRRLAAQIVVEFGDIYLPIFKRMDNEYRAAKARRRLLAKAYRVAKRPVRKSRRKIPPTGP